MLQGDSTRSRFQSAPGGATDGIAFILDAADNLDREAERSADDILGTFRTQTHAQ